MKTDVNMMYELARFRDFGTHVRQEYNIGKIIFRSNKNTSVNV